MEFADELADGFKGAAMPAIQHSLALGYGGIGLLVSVPLLAGGVLELPLGVLAGEGRRRRRAVLGGGVLFVLSLVAAALARNFAELLAAFVIFFPASGAFVSLTQASLMDAAPTRRSRSMAWWDLAGNAGAVTGPLVLALALAAGGGWRGGYLGLAALSAVALAGVTGWRGGPEADDTEPGERAGFREVAAAARAAWRWLVLLEVANLLVDVLTGFVAVYLVAVVHMTPAAAALAVAIRLGAALAGDVVLVSALSRAGEGMALRITALAALPLYPAFLLVPGVAAKLVTLGLLSAVTAAWYPLLQARLYETVPSSIAVTLGSVSSLAGGLGPLAVGVAAMAFGLPWALAGLTVVPVIVLAGSSIPIRRP